MGINKGSYLKVIISLIGIIMLLLLYIGIQPDKTQTIEVETEKIVTVEVEPIYKYNISSVEREMLARLVYLEANTESLECQSAVASVAINRWLSKQWGNTITSVIYAPYQFSPSGLIYKTTPTETNYTAVDQVLKNGSTIPAYVMYFRSEYGFSATWSGYTEYSNIGNVYFGYFLADK